MPVRQTYTYAELELSPAAYDEIEKKLVLAGYSHAFQLGHESGDAIDMHGIGVSCPEISPRGFASLPVNDTWTITVRNKWSERIFFAIGLLFAWPKK